jgi:integrase
MPTLKLTQAAVEKLSPPASGRIEVWDSLLGGFGLRISAPLAGKPARRVWQVMYRVKTGGKRKLVRETLGTLGEIPKVDQARELARQSMAKARAGTNPVAERKAEAAKEEAAATTTFEAVADRYMLEHVERNCAASLIRETGRILERDVKPRWGDKQIGEITKGDVNDLIDEIAARRDRKRRMATGGAAVQANRTLARLKTLFRWAASKGLRDGDPTEGVRKAIKEIPRDRYLEDDEIRAFWAGCDKLGWPFGGLLKTLLLTAQRRDEVGGMRWLELDLDKCQWTIPGERAKNGKAHVVHLSALAIEVLTATPRVGDTLVFTTNGRTPVSGFSKVKERLDKCMPGSAPWILHDLRRTATTGMAQLNIAPHVVDKVLNHVAGTIRGVAATYNRFQYLPERQAALEAWGRYVESLIRPTPTNIVRIAS